MIKYFLLTALSIVTFSLTGQIRKGTICIGGTTTIQTGMAGNSYNYDGKLLFDSQQSFFAITPSAGYFVIDNLASGLIASFLYNSQTTSSDVKIVESSFHIGPYVKYYFETGNIKPFAYIDGGYASKNELSREGDQGQREYSGYRISAGGGASWFINKNFSFDALLLYQRLGLSYLNDNKLTSTSNGFLFQLGISIYL